MMLSMTSGNKLEEQQQKSSSSEVEVSSGGETTTTTTGSSMLHTAAASPSPSPSSSSSSSSSSTSSVSDETTTTTIKVDEAAKEEAAEPIINSGTPSSPQAQTQCDDEDETGAMIIEQQTSTDNNNNNTTSNTSNTQTTESIIPSSPSSSCPDTLLAAKLLSIYDYWKNFDIKKLQDDLNDQIDSMHKTQEEFNELSNKFSELSRELKKLVSEEDELKTVSSLLKLFQNEIDGLSRRCKSTESTCIDLFKLLTNVPDPFPVIESIKTNKCELQLSKRILKLQNENKTLREKLSELLPNKSKMAAEKEIILRLTDNVTKTSSLNLELSSKLKISEGEIESYKKLLSDYQKELFEMKNKHINEIKSEILKENDKQQRKQLESSTSTLQSQNSNTSENNNNSSNNNNTNNKNDKLTSYEMLKKSMSNDALKSAPTNNGTTNNKINNENNSNNPLKLLLDTKCISGSPPPSSSSSSSSYSSTSSSSSSTSSSSVSPSSSTAITPNKQAASVAAAQPLTTSTPSHSDHFSGLKSNYFRSSNPNQSSSSSSSALMSESASTLSDSAANIDLTNNGEFLNTSDIAGRVRDLLSVHNIGQRVFAKYILGLSQGTVSELLSKPKHWSKLTEKGRESYRKMHAWASSDESIGTLKALGPRKGNKDTYFYQNGGAASAANPLSIAPKDSEAASSTSSITTDQKIAAILDEAKRQMMAQGKLDPSSYSAASSPSRSSSRHSSQSAIDDSPYMKREYETNNEEMVANNNEEEDEDHDETEDQQDSEDMPAFRSSQYSYPLDLTTKPKQVLLSMGGENSNPKKRKLDYSMSDNENDTATPISSAQNAVAAALWRQQQFNRPVLSSIDQLKLLSGGQTSSSFSTPTTSSLSNSSTTKPLKCILPPVSQEQFDKYSNINTDELVKRVKDLLSKYSISQRLFGECILGLSQGSVSDLLARPKHWVMLTQKGREPFIRMQMFIDDPDSIKRLMANQYKGPAATTIAAASLSTSPVPTAAAALNILNDCNLNGGAVAAKSLVQSRASSLSSMLNAAALAASPSGLLQIDATKESNNNHKNHNHHHHHHQHSKSFTNNTTSNSHHHHNHHHHNSSFSQENPTEDHISSSPLIKSSSSVNNTPSTPTPTSTSTPAAANIIPYDISQLSALSSDFNTEEITNRVKETLLNNNIGQKLFGEAVLNLSQGTVSELLSKPKPWQTLSIKGREPYLRMYMWLTDAHKLEKLSEWKEERSALKQRAAAASTAAAVASAAAANAAIDHMSGGSSADGEQKPKRRFIFSEEQKEQLMKAFKYDPYPAVTQMEQLAARLGLQTRTVINWFHNHRMRIRYKSNSAGLNNLSNGAANSPSELNPFIHGPQLTSSGGGGRISRANQASRSSQFTSASSQQNPFSSALSGIGETNSSMYNEDETLVSASNYEDDTDMNQSSSSPMNNHHNQASYNDDEMTGGGEEETANYEDDEEAGGTSDNEDESGAEINSLYLNNEANEDEEDEENTDALGNTDLNNNNVNDDEDEDDDEDKYSDNSGHNNTAAHLNSFLQHHSLQSQSHSAKRRKPHNPQKLNYGAAMAAAAMVQAIAAAAASLKQQQQQQHHDD